MSTDVMLRALGDRWRVLAWWVGGVLAYVVFVAALWPSVRDSAGMQDAVADYPDAFKAFFGGDAAFDFTTAAGFLQAQVFSVIVPVLLGIFAIGFAARTLAGEEEEGKLDLLLSHPVSRRDALLEKAAAIAVAVVALGLATWLAFVVMDLIVDLSLGLDRLLAAVLGIVLLTLFHAAVTLLAGALTGKRAVALAVGGLVFSAGYVLTVVADLVNEASWVRYLSPYYYGTGVDALTQPWPIGAHLALLLLAVAGIAAAVVAFERRDIAT